MCSRSVPLAVTNVCLFHFRVLPAVFQKNRRQHQSNAFPNSSSVYMPSRISRAIAGIILGMRPCV